MSLGLSNGLVLLCAGSESVVAVVVYTAYCRAVNAGISDAAIAEVRGGFCAAQFLCRCLLLAFVHRPCG